MMEIVALERVESKIYSIREQKVMLDRDLAELYGVETKVLNQGVKRNIRRFPEDFMFQLTKDEYDSLRSQIVTLEGRGKHSKYLPYAFTENGVAMLSSVLNSERAIQVNIQIMRVFTKLRSMLREYEELKEFVISLAKRQQEDVTHLFMELDRLNRLFESLRTKKQIGFQA
ncbi:MAG TPA: ORF6N domain-containing protein [bacterium]